MNMKYIISLKNIGQQNINQEFGFNKNFEITARIKKYKSKIKKIEKKNMIKYYY